MKCSRSTTSSRRVRTSNINQGLNSISPECTNAPRVQIPNSLTPASVVSCVLGMSSRRSNLKTPANSMKCCSLPLTIRSSYKSSRTTQVSTHLWIWASMPDPWRKNQGKGKRTPDPNNPNFETDTSNSILFVSITLRINISEQGTRQLLLESIPPRSSRLAARTSLRSSWNGLLWKECLDGTPLCRQGSCRFQWLALVCQPGGPDE